MSTPPSGTSSARVLRGEGARRLGIQELITDSTNRVKALERLDKAFDVAYINLRRHTPQLASSLALDSETSSLRILIKLVALKMMKLIHYELTVPTAEQDTKTLLALLDEFEKVQEPINEELTTVSSKLHSIAEGHTLALVEQLLFQVDCLVGRRL